MSYDLEEQNQIEQLRAFWQRWGKLVSLLALLTALGWAGYNGWQFWNNRQSAQASRLYAGLEQQLQTPDLHAAAPLWTALRDGYPSSPYSAMAALELARVQSGAAQTDAARQTLQWLLAHAADPAYRAAAGLNLAALQIDAHQLDAALKTLQQAPLPEFEPLFAMRRGDILALQGELPQARAAYQQALRLLPPESSSRELLRIKLLSVGGQA